VKTLNSSGLLRCVPSSQIKLIVERTACRNRLCSKLRIRSTRRLLLIARGHRLLSICSSSALGIKTSLVSVRPFPLSGIIAHKLTCNVANLPHYTTGQTYYYPAFNAARSEDALKFAHEFGEVVAMPIMLECITRVRASRGTSVFFITSSPLDKQYRAALGVLPRQLLRAIDGPTRHAHGPAEPVLRDRGRD
jgi:protein transport protein SEC24